MATELTFDQLQAISGGATAYEYGLMGFAPSPVCYATPNSVKAELDKSSTKFSAARSEEAKLAMSKPHY